MLPSNVATVTSPFDAPPTTTDRQPTLAIDARSSKSTSIPNLSQSELSAAMVVPATPPNQQSTVVTPYWKISTTYVEM